MGAEGEDADADGEFPAQARGGEEDPLAGVDALAEALVELFEILFGRPRRGETEGEDGELRLGEHLDPLHPTQAVRRQPGERELLLQLLAEGPRAVHLEWQPDAQ